jgi:hypothetical protein
MQPMAQKALYIRTEFRCYVDRKSVSGLGLMVGYAQDAYPAAAVALSIFRLMAGRLRPLV